jgi:hypothetical protein
VRAHRSPGTEGSNLASSSGESAANSVRALRALLDQGEAADQAATRSARMCHRQGPGRRYSSSVSDRRSKPAKNAARPAKTQTPGRNNAVIGDPRYCVNWLRSARTISGFPRTRHRKARERRSFASTSSAICCMPGAPFNGQTTSSSRSASVTPNIWRRPCSPSRQRSRSVGTIGFVGKAAAKIADDGGIPLP